MSRRPIALLLTGAVLASFSVATTATPSSAAPTGCAAMQTDLHLLVQSRSSTSLVTVWQSEVSSAVSNGFVDQGAIAKVSTSSGPGRVAVQRMTRGADFRYAQTSGQVAAATKDGYRSSALPFYAAATGGDSCLTPVFQVTSGGKHRLVAGTTTRDALTKQGWSGSETIFYATGSSTTSVGGASKSPAPAAPAAPTGPVAGPIRGSDSDKAFTFAVMPDTQREMKRSSDTRFENRVKFLVKQQKAWDLRFALHVGDLVDWDTPDHAMYAKAAKGLLPLEAKMPLAIAPGNHDTHAVCPGGSACPGADTRVTVRDTNTYNTYFPKDRFGARAGQFQTGKMDNAYNTLRSGGVDWLILNLELWPRTSVITWANQVVKANPKKNVIVVTHSYLTSSGQIYTSNGGYGATSPKYLYDHLIKLYPNIKMVMSGHTGKSAIRTDKGVKGNTIVSMLQCFHSETTNPVRIVSVHTDTGALYTSIYSPSIGKKEYNQTVKGLKFVR